MTAEKGDKGDKGESQSGKSLSGSPENGKSVIQPWVASILVCPEDKGPLILLESESCLYNPRLKRCYPIRDGIPVLMVEEAEEVTPERHEELMALSATQN
jgi:uncharacterized protein YbaR (Trm112 family)